MEGFIKSNWLDCKQDVLQLSISTIFDSPIANLPWVKIATNYVSSVRDRYLLKKILIFMYYGQDIRLDERCKFLEKHTTEDGSVDEKLLILLDNIDSNTKLMYLSNIFRAVVREDISWDEYWLFNNAVKNMNLNNLSFLRDKQEGQYTGLDMQSLYNNSLAVMSGLDHQVLDGPIVYQINGYGKKLATYLK